MKNATQLPHLIRLLDDDSEVVQAEVAKALAAYGPWLDAELSQLEKPLDQTEKDRIGQLLRLHNHLLLKEQWETWFEVKDEKEKLEKALSILSQFQHGVTHPRSVKQLLNELAEEFLATRSICDVFELANFLFNEKGLVGSKKDFYNPLKSDLVHVIEKKEGIPISLACIYILVGKRLDLSIEGCNFPGHFLARVEGKEGYILVDCFSQGQLLHEKVIAKVDSENLNKTLKVIHTPASANTIIKRVLRNLIEAYKRNEDHETSELMFELYQTVEGDS